MGRPGPGGRLRDGQGESMLLNNAIAKLVIEEGYSYPVESVVQSTPAMQKGLPTGETDVNLEGWQQNIIDWYDQEIGKETILNLGVIYGGYVNRCVNDIRRRPSQPLSQRRSHPRIERRDRRLRSTQGPSDARSAVRRPSTFSRSPLSPDRPSCSAWRHRSEV